MALQISGDRVQLPNIVPIRCSKCHDALFSWPKAQNPCAMVPIRLMFFGSTCPNSKASLALQSLRDYQIRAEPADQIRRALSANRVEFAFFSASTFSAPSYHKSRCTSKTPVQFFKPVITPLVVRTYIICQPHSIVIGNLSLYPCLISRAACKTSLFLIGAFGQE